MNTRHDPLQAAAPVAVAEPLPAIASVASAGPQPQPATPKPALKKRNLGGIAKKKDDTTTKYPTYPDEDGKAAEIMARIAERTETFEALKSALETDKAELTRTIIRPWYLTHFHRKADVPSSVLVNYPVKVTGSGAGVSPAISGSADVEIRAGRVTVKEQYTAFPNEDPFIPILGDAVSKYFRQSFELKIDGDKLPGGEQGDTFMERLQALFAEYDCSDALEAKDCVVPVENFKALRLAEMDLAQSLALENVGDKGLTQCSVSTKNVRK